MELRQAQPHPGALNKQGGYPRKNNPTLPPRLSSIPVLSLDRVAMKDVILQLDLATAQINIKHIARPHCYQSLYRLSIIE